MRSGARDACRVGPRRGRPKDESGFAQGLRPRLVDFTYSPRRRGMTAIGAFLPLHRELASGRNPPEAVAPPDKIGL